MGVFVNRDYGKFVILNTYKKHDGKRNRVYCRIKFLETGFEKEVRYDNAKKGQVKDDSRSDLFECTGYSSSREFGVWRMMMRRCYDPRHKGYKHYGGKGVTVCERWHRFKNFLEDLPEIEGFDNALFKSGKIDLDKDRKSKGKKIYSLETCMFISRSENLKGRRWAKKAS